MSDKNGQRPLLYIHQPFSQAPEGSMQATYTNKREKVKAWEDSLDGKRGNTFSYNDESDGSFVASNEEKNTEKNRSGFKKVKSFKEMNLKERLDYLGNFPKVLPPAPCVFYTKETNFQGYLVEYLEDKVTIQFHDQTTKTLAVEELRDVIMIGIKR